MRHNFGRASSEQPSESLPGSQTASLDLRLRIFTNTQALAQCAAQLLQRLCAQAVAQRGVFTLALSGGETPKALFRVLRAAPDLLDWPHCRIFWVDERCVPPDHPRSNYAMAATELLDHVPAGQVFRMRGEDNPAQAARDYEQLLAENLSSDEPLPENLLGADLMPHARVQSRTSFPVRGVPRLDCVLLGMGNDGHVASLFPGQPDCDEREKTVIAVTPPELEPRLSLSLPVLNAATTCLVLVSGSSKHKPLRRALDLAAPPDLPIQRIRPTRGELCFMTDRTAFFGA